MSDDMGGDGEHEIESGYVRGCDPWPTGYRITETVDPSGRVRQNLELFSGSSRFGLALSPTLAAMLAPALERAAAHIPEGQPRYDHAVPTCVEGTPVMVPRQSAGSASVINRAAEGSA